MLLWRVNAKGFGGKVQLVSWCQTRALNGFQYLAGVLWIGKNKTTLNCLHIKSLSDFRYCEMVWLKGTWPSFSINCYSTLFYHYISWHFTFRGPKLGGRHETLHSYFHLFFVILDSCFFFFVFFSLFLCVLVLWYVPWNFLWSMWKLWVSADFGTFTGPWSVF